MFQKVLIAEDHEIANLSLQKALTELGVTDAKYVYYCDDAFAWLRNAQKAGEPYQLLITDLFFEEDHNKQRLTNGFELIKAASAEQADLKVIVFSAESRSYLISELFNAYGIDGYVRKARRDAQHLKAAVQAAYNGNTYQTPEVKDLIRENNIFEFGTADVAIVKLLSQGVLQKEIPIHLGKQNITPSGLSSVEKRLSLMRDALQCSNNEQLIAHCKDIGMI